MCVDVARICGDREVTLGFLSDRAIFAGSLALGTKAATFAKGVGAKGLGGLLAGGGAAAMLMKDEDKVDGNNGAADAEHMQTRVPSMAPRPS